MNATKLQDPRRQISVRLPKSLILKAKVKAAEEEGSVQDIIERALRRELK
jgi:predicted HicB family RNase H-like nuclease